MRQFAQRCSFVDVRIKLFLSKHNLPVILIVNMCCTGSTETSNHANVNDDEM